MQALLLRFSSRKFSLRSSFLLFAAALLACSPTAPQPTVAIAVATDLAPWARAHQQQLSDALGAPVTIIAGPSGQLVTQLNAGAPFDLLLSADRATLGRLSAAARCDDGSVRTFAAGHLGIALARHLSDSPSSEALASATVARIAIANPEHAPYGRLARSYLEGLPDAAHILPKLVIASSAADAAAWVDRGAVDAAVTAWSLLRVQPEARRAKVVEATALPATGLVCGSSTATLSGRWKALTAAPWFRATLAAAGFGPPP